MQHQTHLHCGQGTLTAAEGGCLAATADLLVVVWMEPVSSSALVAGTGSGPTQEKQLRLLCTRCREMGGLPGHCEQTLPALEGSAPWWAAHCKERLSLTTARVASGVPAVADQEGQAPQVPQSPFFKLQCSVMCKVVHQQPLQVQYFPAMHKLLFMSGGLQYATKGGPASCRRPLCLLRACSASF